MTRTTALLIALTLAAAAAQAQTTASEPWVRSTVPGQKATGMFVTLKSTTGTRLVSASSPMAEIVEIHEMSMDAGVMKMRAVPSLDLPAGQPVALKPGGYHVMLMGLKQQVKPGDTVPVNLLLQAAGGKEEKLQINAPAKPLAAQHGH